MFKTITAEQQEKLKKAHAIHCSEWIAVGIQPLNYQDWLAEIKNCPRSFAQFTK